MFTLVSSEIILDSALLDSIPYLFLLGWISPQMQVSWPLLGTYFVSSYFMQDAKGEWQLNASALDPSKLSGYSESWPVKSLVHGRSMLRVVLE